MPDRGPLVDRAGRVVAMNLAIADGGRRHVGIGFALPIERLIGKRKLSQNRDAADQAGVRQGLLANRNPQDHALAHLMVKE